MNYVFAVSLLGAGAFLTALAALAVRVFIKLVLRGPAAAEEAFERGDSLRAWWLCSQTPMTLEGPRDSERLAFGGREDEHYGEVLVEERASTPALVH